MRSNSSNTWVLSSSLSTPSKLMFSLKNASSSSWKTPKVATIILSTFKSIKKSLLLSYGVSSKKKRLILQLKPQSKDGLPPAQKNCKQKKSQHNIKTNNISTPNSKTISSILKLTIPSYQSTKNPSIKVDNKSTQSKIKLKELHFSSFNQSEETLKEPKDLSAVSLLKIKIRPICWKDFYDLSMIFQ